MTEYDNRKVVLKLCCQWHDLPSHAIPCQTTTSLPIPLLYYEVNLYYGFYDMLWLRLFIFIALSAFYLSRIENLLIHYALQSQKLYISFFTLYLTWQGKQYTGLVEAMHKFCRFADGTTSSRCILRMRHINNLFTIPCYSYSTFCSIHLRFRFSHSFLFWYK